MLSCLKSHDHSSSEVLPHCLKSVSFITLPFLGSMHLFSTLGILDCCYWLNIEPGVFKNIWPTQKRHCLIWRELFWSRSVKLPGTFTVLPEIVIGGGAGFIFVVGVVGTVGVCDFEFWNVNCLPNRSEYTVTMQNLLYIWVYKHKILCFLKWQG